MYGHREKLPSVTPDQQRIQRKNKIKKTPDTLITRKETIQEPIHPCKMEKEYTIPDVEKVVKKRTQFFRNTVDYRGDTNEKTHGSDYFPSETDGCVRKPSE